MVQSQVGIEYERIRTLTQLHLNALLEGCEMYGVQVDDDLAEEFAKEILEGKPQDRAEQPGNGCYSAPNGGEHYETQRVDQK